MQGGVFTPAPDPPHGGFFVDLGSHHRVFDLTLDQIGFAISVIGLALQLWQMMNTGPRRRTRVSYRHWKIGQIERTSYDREDIWS